MNGRIAIQASRCRPPYFQIGGTAWPALRNLTSIRRKRRCLPSGAFASFLLFIFFEPGVMKITRDGFGNSFIGKFCRVVVFARIHQRLDRFFLFFFG
jgi:hypothetical protein